MLAAKSKLRTLLLVWTTCIRPHMSFWTKIPRPKTRQRGKETKSLPRTILNWWLESATNLSRGHPRSSKEPFVKAAVGCWYREFLPLSLSMARTNELEAFVGSAKPKNSSPWTIRRRKSRRNGAVNWVVHAVPIRWVSHSSYFVEKKTLPWSHFRAKAVIWSAHQGVCSPRSQRLYCPIVEMLSNCSRLKDCQGTVDYFAYFLRMAFFTLKIVYLLWLENWLLV